MNVGGDSEAIGGISGKELKNLAQVELISFGKGKQRRLVGEVSQDVVRYPVFVRIAHSNFADSSIWRDGQGGQM